MSRSRAIATVVLVVALALGFSSSVVLGPEADAVVSNSTLTRADGAVFVGHDGSAFTSAREGDVIAAGDTLRTGRGATAEFTYVEGSSVRVDSDTQIVVASLRTSDVGVGQALGRAWHVVTSLISGGSRYEVRTPSSTASVRG